MPVDKPLFVPIDINCAQHLPKVTGRKYDPHEALLSVQIDYFKNNLVTESGYAKLWKWNRKTVKRFLEQIGVEIIYLDQSKSSRNQKGHISIHKRDILRTNKGHIKFTDLRQVDNERDILRTNKGHKKDILMDTTNKKEKINNKKYSEDSKEFRASVFLLNKIRERKPDFKIPNMQQWAEQADYIFRLDLRDPSEVKKVIEWCQQDEFWQNNILSMAKLRKQYDQLILKMGKQPVNDHGRAKAQQKIEETNRILNGDF